MTTATRTVETLMTEPVAVPDQAADSLLLSPAEEQQLAVAMEAGVLAAAALDEHRAPGGATRSELVALVRMGADARRRFVLANLGLVRSLSAPEARRSSLPEHELFQEGCVGLLRSIHAFDHRRGCRFSTFAFPRVRAVITLAAARRLGARELPGWRALLLRRANGVAGRLAVQLGREPDLDEIAADLELSPDEVGDLLAHRRPASLEQLLEAGFEADVTVAGVGSADVDELAAALEMLPSPDREVLCCRFGFDDGRAHSRTDTSRCLRMGRDRVREVEMRGLSRLRGALAGSDRAAERPEGGLA